MSKDLQSIGGSIEAMYRALGRPMPSQNAPPVLNVEREEQVHWEKQQGGRSMMLQLCGCPRLLVDRVLAGSLEERPPLEVVSDFIPSGRTTLTMMGGTRIGKSLACVYVQSLRTVIRPISDAAGRRFRLKFYDSNQRFISAPELGSINTAGYNNDDDRKLMWSLKTVDLLVIDDLGTELKPIDRIVQDILNTRLSRGKRTMMTTNLDPKTFSENYGQRVWARLISDGSIVDFDGGAA